MKCFLTSNPILGDSINPANGFLEKLKNAIPDSCKALFISSDPDGYSRTDFHSAALRACLENSGFSFDCYLTLDHRNHNEAENLIERSDFIILAGGHVPTQNTFFHEIDLSSKLKTFRGTLMGISAGTMNSAEMVYVHPEREGEAVDPNFQRFRPGLGLTQCMVLPHYQMIKDDILDGLRVFEEIAYPDSVGRKFYALVDGSYILSCEESEALHGEAFLIENGDLRQISAEGDTVRLM